MMQSIDQNKNSPFKEDPYTYLISDSAPSAWPDFLIGHPEKPVRVLLIDDNIHVRTVIAQEIMSDLRTILVGQAGSVRDGRRIILQNEFDVMLVDLNLGDGEGFELIDLMKKKNSAAEAIIFSVIETEDKVLKAFEIGAKGYLIKNSWFNSYPQAILEVANGGASITPSLARRLIKHLDKSKKNIIKTEGTENLSHREREVLQLIANGYTSAEVGSQLEISTLNVNTHIKSIYKKLQVKTRAQAVRFAHLKGLF